jgi:DNA-directed RNA polymerase subunit N (RpoN/RPB10)
VKRNVGCTATHNDKKPHPVSAGLRVCRPCHDKTDRALTVLPGLAAELLRAHMGQGDGLHVSATVDYVPYRDAVGDERHSIVGDLAAWSAYVAGQRHVTPPADIYPSTTAQFLRTHLEWLCRDDWAADFCELATDHYTTARRLLYPGHRRVFTITTENGTPARCLDCGEPLSALLRSTDDLLPAEIRCTGCGVAIPASLWVTYGRQLRKALAITEAS